MPSAADTIQATGRDASASRLWPVASLAVAVGSAGILALFWDSVGAALAVWTDASAHRVRYFVLPIAAYFIWLRRHQVRDRSPSPTMLGPLLALPFAALWLVSYVAAVRLGEQIAVVGLIEALLLGVLGLRVYRVLLFPFLLLWLLVPAGDSLVPWLLDLTAWMTTVGLDLAGLSPQVDGNLIIVQSGRYKVVEECAALDFLLGSFMIALVYAGLMYQRLGKRVLYIATALIVAMIANGVRTTTVVLITHLSDRQIDLARDHATYGWVLFFLAMVLTMAAGYRFRDNAEAMASPLPPPETNGSRVLPRIVIATLAILFIGGLPPAYAAFVVPQRLPLGATVGICLPERFGSWTQVGGPLDWRPVFPGADGRSIARYVRGDATVNLYVLYYWAQAEGAEMIGWGNRLADNKTTWFWSESHRATAVLGDEPLTVMMTRLRSKQRRLQVWQWYWIDGRSTSSALVAKLLQAKATLLHGDPRAAVLLLAAEEHGAPRQAEAALQTFMADAGSVASVLGSADAVSDGVKACQ